jgi:hypothetical protein
MNSYDKLVHDYLEQRTPIGTDESDAQDRLESGVIEMIFKETAMLGLSPRRSTIGLMAQNNSFSVSMRMDDGVDVGDLSMIMLDNKKVYGSDGDEIRISGTLSFDIIRKYFRL